MSYKNLHRILAIMFFILCSLIVVYTRELGAIRGYVGDVVVIMLLYSLIQGVYPLRPLFLVSCILILAFIIEGLQGLDFLSYIGGSESSLLNLIFGSVFDPLDILAYFAGGIMIALLDRYLFIPTSSRPPSC